MRVEIEELLLVIKEAIRRLVGRMEKIMAETKDESLKEIYRDYLRETREMMGIVGKLVGKMYADKVVDPAKAEFLLKAEREE